MIERTAADWEALTREYGRLAGDLLTYQRVLAERDAEVADLRARQADAESATSADAAGGPA
jgi:hypothetical protein